MFSKVVAGCKNPFVKVVTNYYFWKHGMFNMAESPEKGPTFGNAGYYEGISKESSRIL